MEVYANLDLTQGLEKVRFEVRRAIEVEMTASALLG